MTLSENAIFDYEFHIMEEHDDHYKVRVYTFTGGFIVNQMSKEKYNLIMYLKELNLSRDQATNLTGLIELYHKTK